MVIDTSALLAIAFDEPERSEFLDRVAADPTRLLSVASFLEAGIAIESRPGPGGGR